MRAAGFLLLLSLAALAQDHESALREGERLRDGGDVAAAREKFEEAMRLAPDPVARAVAESWVAQCLEDEHRYEDALPHRKAVLETYRKEHAGKDHPDLAEVIGALGDCLERARGGAEALPLYEEALAMRRRLSPDGDAELVRALTDLARCCRGLRRVERALALAEEGLAVHARLEKPEIEQEAGLRNEEGLALHNLGRNAEALVELKEALRLTREAGVAPADLATQLENLGLCLRALDRYAEALAALDEAMEVHRKSPGWERDPTTVTRLSNRGALLIDLGRDREAAECFDAAVTLARKLLPETHQIVANSLNNRAVHRLELGRYREALEDLRAVLAVTRSWGENDYVAETLKSIVTALIATGREQEALAAAREAVEIAQRLHPGDHLLVATALFKLGECLTRAGKDDEGIACTRRGLAMWRRFLPPGHSDHAVAVYNLAGSLANVGRHAEALPLYEEALARAERALPAGNPFFAQLLVKLAFCEGELGRHAEAAAVYERVLKADLRAPVREAALRGLHHALIGLGRYAEARERAKEAVAASREIEGSPALCEALRALAHAEHLAGDTGQAVQRAREALEVARRVTGSEGAETAYALGDLAMYLDASGENCEAIRLCEEALALGRSRNDPFLHRATHNLATIYLHAGRAAEAIPLFAEAIEEIETRRRSAAGLAREEQAAYFARLSNSGSYEGMIDAQTRVGRADLALEYLERSRAREVLDLLERSRFDPLAEARRRAEEQKDGERVAAIDAVATRLQALDARIGSCTHAVTTLGAAREPDRERIGELEAERTKAFGDRKEALRERARLVRDLVPEASPRPIAAIQAALKRDELLLYYLVTSKAAVLFVVPPAGEAVERHDLRWPDGTPADEASVATAVERHLAAMADRAGKTRGVGRPAAETAPLPPDPLFFPLMPVWSKVEKASRVYVVPHGALHRLPFETLRVKGDDLWLDAGPPIAYVPSGSVLAWAKERRDRQRAREPRYELVALGDPVFAREAPEDMSPPEKGVLVTFVDAGTAAADVGLRPGDVLLAYDGAALDDAGALGGAIQHAQAGEGPVPLRVWRAGQTGELNVAPGRLGVMIDRRPPREGYAALVAEGGLAAERSGGGFGALPPLPGTRREIESLRATFDGASAVFLLGEEATRPRLFEVAPQARYLHLATHQILDETEGGGFSRLALTLPRLATPWDSGFLTLEELFERWRDRLSGCELVVLSACETQRGPAVRDEAPFAMPLGFLYAGAPAVIASLWRVDDASTAELFADFYKRLEEGKGKLDAFTEARKALKKKHPEAYFWAPFVYVGDPR